MKITINLTKRDLQTTINYELTVGKEWNAYQDDPDLVVYGAQDAAEEVAKLLEKHGIFLISD